MLLYAYWFKHPSGESDVVFYDCEEAAAREQYLEYFGTEAKTLIKRDRW